MSNPIEYLIKQALSKRIKAPSDLHRLKNNICSKYDVSPPTNTSILKAYQKLIKQGKARKDRDFLQLLQIRKIRTLSGVAPIAVLTKPYPCPGTCIYCPTEKNMPKSYLSNEPAVMRAVLNKFNPYRQVQTRLRALEDNGHPTDKCELIVIGGTWSCLPNAYQSKFIKRCFDGFNSVKSKDLAIAKRINEKAKHRCVGLTLETRPDYVYEKEIKRMRELGATRAEIGIQHVDDKILKLNKRGHDIAETIRATQLLKEAGFKITYHLMPNLPGSTTAKDLKMFKEVFSNADFQPDQIKIYPCVVTKNSQIYKWWRQGKYKPYSPAQLKNLLIKIKQITPPYVRITRLIRDIPKESIVAGNKITNLRQILKEEMNKEGLQCRCIRCREARTQITRLKQSKLFIKKYKASEGQELFLSYESANRKIIYAFLRLRFNQHDLDWYPVLENAALIREVHTYGALVPLELRDKKAAQHFGLGKKLIKKAEQLARQIGYKKMAVISGVGVRGYYRKLGYQLQDEYMVKRFP